MLSIAALMLVGKRKPARATRRLPGDAESRLGFDEIPTPAERVPSAAQRVTAALGLGVTAVVAGALVVLVVSVGVALLVVTLSGMLG